MITFLGLLVGTIIIFIVGMQIARRFTLLDKPGKDVPKRKRVPTLQGVTLIAGFFILGYIFYPHYFALHIDNPFLGLLLGGVLVAGVSLVDELGLVLHKKYRISASVRLFVHIVGALLAFLVSGVGITQFQLPGGILLEFGLLSTLLLTVGWYLLFINGINRFDGVYGLASGMASIGFGTIALLLSLVVFRYYPEMSADKFTLLSSVYNISLLLCVLSLVAFIMERKPFGLMRDVGTMFLGFSLAYLALLGGTKIGMMIVVLALPLFDAVWVIIDRLHRRKKHPFHGDYSHLHYRLLALGRNRNEVRVAILGISLFLLIFMLLLGADRTGKVVIFLLVALVFFGINGYLYRVKGLPVEYSPQEHKSTNKGSKKETKKETKKKKSTKKKKYLLA